MSSFTDVLNSPEFCALVSEHIQHEIARDASFTRNLLMGCDIHLVIEWRRDEHSPWQCIAGPSEGLRDPADYVDPDFARLRNEEHGPERRKLFGPRNYALFTLLAGVRSYGDEPVYPPRGIPSDVSRAGHSFLTCYGVLEDYHSHSYLDLTEVTAAIVGATNQEPWVTEDFVRDVVDRWMAPIARKRGFRNVRCIFAFDN